MLSSVLRYFFIFFIIILNNYLFYYMQLPFEVFSSQVNNFFSGHMYVYAYTLHIKVS